MLPSRSGILAEAISMYRISAWTGNSNVMDLLYAQKGYFQSKTEKVNINIEYCIFELV